MARTSASRKKHSTCLSPGYTGDDDYPSWTWDPTSGEDLTKGTTVAARPGHTLSWATTTNHEVLSPATQNLPDTGEDWPGCPCQGMYVEVRGKMVAFSLHKHLYPLGQDIRPVCFCFFGWFF